MDHHLIRQRFHLQNAVFSRIDHEDATVAIVYRVTRPTGEELILKICPRENDYWRELYFLKRLAGLKVPRIVQAAPPEAGNDGAILMERLSGALLTDCSEKLAYEIGAELARIHLNRAAGYGDLIRQDKLNPDPCVHFTQKFEEGFAECSEHLPKVLLEQCRRYFDAHIHLLATVDGPCLAHRDFRPGNVMVYKGQLQGVIDWASGRASFAEEDFCPLEHGEWPAGWKQPFLAGYESVRPVPNFNSIMPLLRLSRAFATIGFLVKTGRWNTTHTRVYQFNRHFLDTFF